MTQPSKVFVKLKYTNNPTNITIPDVPGVYCQAITSGNDISTPQPTGFDQWAAMFRMYTVFKSKISLKIATVNPANAPNQRMIRMSLLPTTQQVSSPGLVLQSFQDQAAYSNPWVKSRYVGVMTGNHDCITLAHKARTKQMFPHKDIQDDEEFSGFTGGGGSTLSGPTADHNWNWVLAGQVMAGNAVGVDQTIVVYMQVTYWVEFSQPVVLQDS